MEVLFLYIFIFFVSSFFAFCSQKVVFEHSLITKKAKTVTRPLLLFLSFFVLWAFLFFSDSGPDYEPYIIILERLSWDNYGSFSDLEPGFNIFLLMIRSLCNDNLPLTIAVIKTISLIIVFLSFLLLKNHIHFGFSIMCYALFCYLKSFYLLPMMLAASIIMLANAFFKRFNIVILPLVLIVLSAQVHNAAYIYLVIFLMSILLTKGKNFSFPLKAMIVLSYIVAIVGYSYIFNFASKIMPSFHYANYIKTSGLALGFFWFILYIPLFIILLYLWLYEKDGILFNLVFLYAISSALVKALSYSFDTIGRVELFLMPLYCIFISCSLFKNGLNAKTKNRNKVFAFLICSYVFMVSAINLADEMKWMSEFSFTNPFIGSY